MAGLPALLSTASRPKKRTSHVLIRRTCRVLATVELAAHVRSDLPTNISSAKTPKCFEPLRQILTSETKAIPAQNRYAPMEVSKLVNELNDFLDAILQLAPRCPARSKKLRLSNFRNFMQPDKLRKRLFQ